MLMLLALSANLATPASLMAPARPVAPESWMSDDDYPKQSLKNAERGHVFVSITTSPTGQPLHCEPIFRSALAKDMCPILLKRARFEPALDAQGAPTFGVYQHLVTFRIPGTTAPPRPSRATLALTVDQLPQGIADPTTIRVRLLVDQQGHSRDCQPMRYETAQDERAVFLLGPTACAQVSTTMLPIARDETGRALESVQDAIISFATPGRMERRRTH